MGLLDCLPFGRHHPVYLVDFQCFTIPDKLKRSKLEVVDGLRTAENMIQGISEDDLAFHEETMDKCGLGDATGLSEGILSMMKGVPDSVELEAHMQQESEMVLNEVVEQVLRKTGTSPREIDILVVACSCYVPFPSMAAMLVHRLGFRSDCMAINLGGMGCAANATCVQLAQQLLDARPGRRALIVNHENITACLYTGCDRSMMASNCLYRLGGAAAILSNRPDDARRAKYKLVAALRRQPTGKAAFGAARKTLDAAGRSGIKFTRDVYASAAAALEATIRAAAPKLLPLSELAKCATDKAHRPSFARAAEHVQLPPPLRLINGLAEKLQLPPGAADQSRATLARFGYTSSAFAWYVLAGAETASGGVKKGDRVWQLTTGAAIEGGSVLWKARRAIKEQHECWQ